MHVLPSVPTTDILILVLTLYLLPPILARIETARIRGDEFAQIYDCLLSHPKRHFSELNERQLSKLRKNWIKGTFMAVVGVLNLAQIVARLTVPHGAGEDVCDVAYSFTVAAMNGLYLWEATFNVQMAPSLVVHHGTVLVISLYGFVVEPEGSPRTNHEAIEWILLANCVAGVVGYHGLVCYYLYSHEPQVVHALNLAVLFQCLRIGAYIVVGVVTLIVRAKDEGFFFTIVVVVGLVLIMPINFFTAKDYLAIRAKELDFVEEMNLKPEEDGEFVYSRMKDNNDNE